VGLEVVFAILWILHCRRLGPHLGRLRPGGAALRPERTGSPAPEAAYLRPRVICVPVLAAVGGWRHSDPALAATPPLRPRLPRPAAGPRAQL